MGLHINFFTASRALCCIGVLLPFVYLVLNAFAPAGEHWQYVKEHMLPTYLWETFILALGCALCTLVLGISLAWLTSMHHFWGKRFFEAALILPLAIPPYIAAYIYDGLLNYTGTLQSFMRNYWGLDIGVYGVTVPALAWAIFIFSISLFPYVYMLARTFLRQQSASLFENAWLLGGSKLRMFRLVALPLLMPAAMAGVILVCLEVLNDFGVVSYYGLNTFTTAIFSAWFGMGDADTAIKLAAILLALVLAVLLLRQALQRAQRYRIVSSREKPFVAQPVRGPRHGLIVGLCLVVTLISFFIPLAQMFYWLYLTWDSAFNRALASTLGYTIYVALVATTLIMLAATATANANRMFGGRRAAVLAQVNTLGYSIPSAVLAIGVITFFAALDSWLQSGWLSLDKITFSTGSLMLIFALGVRFFTIGYQSVETGFSKIGMIYSEASRTLGRGVGQTFLRVDLPLLRHAVIGGAVLVFIDILKELPLSLILRPFNCETLGTTVYHYVNNEVLERIALPSLLIVLVGAVFIVLMQCLENRR